MTFYSAVYYGEKKNFAGVISSEIIWQGYKRCRNLGWNNFFRGSLIKQKKGSLMEVLFFMEESAFCRPHLNFHDNCNELNCAVANLNKLKKYLKSAKSTIDVCMYFFTSQQLADVIMEAQKRGVVVRIIIDANMAEHNDNQAIPFRKASIKVRTKSTDNLMHHKFAIIDDDILITGSANWTMQALFGNSENIIITNHPILLKRFIDEFKRLWKIYDKDFLKSVSFESHQTEIGELKKLENR
ncbi:mitochondrial cardiolipin hydrolase [Vespa crabro]|uniref:mitochondrial cardiolipin hydrolase n=2 Tax=Vespa TaxID=7443 RepID=UPI001F004E90|nr:mitochondrial cardiolipin hydrolase [Vespa crabro]